ncbi:hypothetical protein MLD38_015855 [Melastoma candidum]|uniref:Uncharacterized protein n=1 Tax=Melastoma candidum TaxID=119954 RepID=A0ACB9RKK6_9MYRT|nr:hypothetical protein MLD38_015855 [Melastoma candidum]
MRNAARLFSETFSSNRHFPSPSSPSCYSSTSVARNPTLSPAMDPSRRYCFDPKLKWNPVVKEYFVAAYGEETFARLSEALTRPSSYSCIRVNTLNSSVDFVLEKLRALVKESVDMKSSDGLNSRRNSGDIGSNLASSGCSVMELDSITEANAGSSNEGAPCSEDQGGSVSKCQIPGLDYVIFVKGSGPHQINYGYTSNGPPKEVIVSRKCAEAVLRGAQVYVPGVMGCSAHVEKGDVVAVSVAVEQHNPTSGWGLHMTRGIVLQGRQTDPYYEERNGLYIGQGIAMMSRAGIFRASEGVAIDMTNRVYRLPSFNDVLEGEIFLQNLPSIVTAHALDPQKGERILDMCAAPGGKTTAIAHLMKDEGVVVAVDRSHNKVHEIENLATELGLNCITTYKLDALKAVRKECALNDSILSNLGECIHADAAVETFSGVEGHQTPLQSRNPLDLKTDSFDDINVAENGECKEAFHVKRVCLKKSTRRMKNGPGRNQEKGARVENSKGFAPQSFNRVLLDAPCSALGLRPRLFAGEETVESLRNHAKYQRRMFDQAVQLVCPGGVIVYSTCTINPGENEALVRYALDTYKFLSLAPQHPRVGGPGLVGSYTYPDGYKEEWLKPGEEHLVQRFDPSSPLDSIGFFIAKFVVDKSRG